MMRRMQDAIHHRIPQVQVRRSHVDLGAQRARAIRKFALPHALEQIQILFDGSIAIRALLARLGQRAAILAHFVSREVINIRLACFDQLHRPGVKLVEVIGGVEHPIAPVRTQPARVRDDRVDILLLFLLRIGIVEAQIRFAAELFGQAKVQADRFRVTDVQIAVRLRRKARVHAALVLVGLQIVKNDIADEVRRPRGRFRRGCCSFPIAG